MKCKNCGEEISICRFCKNELKGSIICDYGGEDHFCDKDCYMDYLNNGFTCINEGEVIE